MTWTYSTIGPLIGYLDSTYLSVRQCTLAGLLLMIILSNFMNNQPLPTVELEKDPPLSN